MNPLTARTRRSRRLALGASIIVTFSLAVTGCSSTGGSDPHAKLTIGEIFPFTGGKSILSDWGTHGVGAGIYEVNHNGGVMGHQLKTASADDAADSVDTLPAFRKLMLDSPVAVIGPFSPTIEAVIGNFGANHVPDFMIGGTTALDKMKYPYVFRVTSSDSNESVAMAYYAAKTKGLKTASLIFDNSANSQGFIAPLTAAFKKLGGTVQSTQTIVPGQGSYRSELSKAFAGHPDVIFSSFDTQTASTLWANAAQLGYLDTPWIGDDLQSSKAYATAFGPKAPTNLFAAVAASPSGNGYAHFLADYKSVYGPVQPLPTTFNEYDSIVIAALAMTEAKSTDPKVWVTHVKDVASPPGTQCTDYKACVALLTAGKQIDYQGAGGDDNFNAYHNVFSGFSVVGFNSDLTNTDGTYVTPAQISASAG
ncbi:amino acid ABC transporter substrate-binding protein [Diaminobutyricibacter tongyongensis]|uniref:Amino acid ABC transporter substrate-binding protein n=1 Tax=Leifsonia tongyongensis TaxID=1268043 RepID=A0A6L9XTX4_9MICO|nr:ABC transporter substrate-binding protein [Diaminobutyricibacter tongyongensis]NEN04707.1 amino acid ABC transporter substrate-binding protein [Diaminobutyricibacter tongyongensis]